MAEKRCSKEYCVTWKREGQPRKRKIYQTRKSAEESLEPDGEQFRRMTAPSTAPFEDEPRLEVRDVGEWSRTVSMQDIVVQVEVENGAFAFWRCAECKRQVLVKWEEPDKQTFRCQRVCAHNEAEVEVVLFASDPVGSLREPLASLEAALRCEHTGVAFYRHIQNAHRSIQKLFEDPNQEDDPE